MIPSLPLAEAEYGGEEGGYDSDSEASEGGAGHAAHGPGEIGEGLAPEALHWLLHGGVPGAQDGPAASGVPSGTSKGWAGAAHWRFKAGAGAGVGAGEDVGEEVDQGPRKKRKAAAGCVGRACCRGME